MRIAFVVLLALGASCASVAPPGEEPAGAERFGPFYDREQRTEGEVTQFRPLYWKKVDRYGTSVNILAPLYRYREDEAFKRLQILPNIFYTERKKKDGVGNWFFIFFPFLFVGNDDFLLLPFGGYSKGFFGLNEFLMVTPLYLRTKRITSHRIDPITFTTRAILFPFLSWGSDGRPGGRRSFRFWPLYSRKDQLDGGESGFVLWPFYTWAESRKSRSRQWHLWPFYGKTVTPTLQEQTILWPIFTRRQDFLTGMTDTAVWPFWRKAVGPDNLREPWPAEVHRYWPLYEYRRVRNTTTEFLAWPFLRRTYVDEPHQFGEYRWAVPFYRRLRLVSREDGFERKKTVVWPVVRTESNSAGETEVVVPPLLPFDAPTLREWAEPIRPFLSLYHRHEKPGGRTDTSVALGAVMKRQDDQRKSVRLLWGLLGWDRRPEGRYLHLLWGLRIRLGDAK